MIRSSDRSAEILCTSQLSSIPIDGKWFWNEKTKELVYESRNGVNEERKMNSTDKLKVDIRSGLIHYRRQDRPLQRISKIKDDKDITLADVIR